MAPCDWRGVCSLLPPSMHAGCWWMDGEDVDVDVRIEPPASWGGGWYKVWMVWSLIWSFLGLVDFLQHTYTTTTIIHESGIQNLEIGRERDWFLTTFIAYGITAEDDDNKLLSWEGRRLKKASGYFYTLSSLQTESIHIRLDTFISIGSHWAYTLRPTREYRSYTVRSYSHSITPILNHSHTHSPPLTPTHDLPSLNPPSLLPPLQTNQIKNAINQPNPRRHNDMDNLDNNDGGGCTYGADVSWVERG